MKMIEFFIEEQLSLTPSGIQLQSAVRRKAYVPSDHSTRACERDAGSKRSEANLTVTVLTRLNCG